MNNRNHVKAHFLFNLYPYTRIVYGDRDGTGEQWFALLYNWDIVALGIRVNNPTPVQRVVASVTHLSREAIRERLKRMKSGGEECQVSLWSRVCLLQVARRERLPLPEPTEVIRLRYTRTGRRNRMAIFEVRLREYAWWGEGAFRYVVDRRSDGGTWIVLLRTDEEREAWSMMERMKGDSKPLGKVNKSEQREKEQNTTGR